MDLTQHLYCTNNYIYFFTQPEAGKNTAPALHE